MSTATLTTAPAVWQIDAAHSSAQFSVRHLMISNVRGEFSKVTGTVVYDAADPANSKLDVAIDANSINTRDAQRDAHLKSPDFLDTAQFPTLNFRSTEFRQTEDGFQIKGDLTIRGVTRAVVLEVDGPTTEMKDPWGFTRIGATATTRINRKDWGLTWNAALETGGVVVGDEVKITLDLEAIKQQQ
jgi:polyisoprenoid-binding protein YceI